MTAVSQTTRAWTILRHRLRQDVIGLPVIWVLYATLVVVFAAGITLFGPDRLDRSAWEQGAHIARWYAGGVGVYLTAIYLPVYIAHGCTRRDYAVQLPALILAIAAALAALMTLGYALETLAYRALGWSQQLSGAHLFDAPTQYPLIFLEFLLIFAVWILGGAVLGAAFYRRFLLGMALIPVALILGGVIEVAAGPRYLGPLTSAPEAGWLATLSAALGSGSPGPAAAVWAGVFAIGMALVWALVRNLPVRSKAT